MTHTVAAQMCSTPPFAVTVATALAWLGHECDGGCPALAMSTQPACGSFLSRRPGISRRMESLIVVDPGDAPRTGG